MFRLNNDTIKLLEDNYHNDLVREHGDDPNDLICALVGKQNTEKVTILRKLKKLLEEKQSLQKKLEKAQQELKTLIDEMVNRECIKLILSGLVNTFSLVLFGSVGLLSQFAFSAHNMIWFCKFVIEAMSKTNEDPEEVVNYLKQALAKGEIVQKGIFQFDSSEWEPLARGFADAQCPALDAHKTMAACRIVLSSFTQVLPTAITDMLEKHYGLELQDKLCKDATAQLKDPNPAVARVPDEDIVKIQKMAFKNATVPAPYVSGNGGSNSTTPMKRHATSESILSPPYHKRPKLPRQSEGKHSQCGQFEESNPRKRARVSTGNAAEVGR
ncbi:expressed unknown protein [Seminavis robusta]|uniref:Uncharacterized protein n=1 Tax=Seminavis robusta TaxID=568900 RepID=A0A9N8E3F2_9STRA|nr:expressed unknown protein [Seminavis robusta]|eukprot:Sro609_g175020.1 n/a (327) ;mRNA; r:24917-25973